MLTRLKVNGFKNLVDVDVRFGPFTCIAGVNAAGKSNLFDAIRFLSLLAEKPLVEAARAVRGSGNRSVDIRSLFTRIGDEYVDEMSFEAEMIVPAEGIDDLGMQVKAGSTLVHYGLTLAHRSPGSFYSDDRLFVRFESGLEVVSEQLNHLGALDAAQSLGFDSSAEWLASAVRGQEAKSIIDMEHGPRGEAMVVLRYADETRPHWTQKSLASTLRRTLLSRIEGDQVPTAVLAQQEMRSWRVFQLDPAKIGETDSLLDPPEIGEDGSHVAAALYRLAHEPPTDGRDPYEAETAVYARVSNRLAQLVDDIRDVTVDLDEARDALTVLVTDRSGVTHRAKALSDGTLRFLALAVLEQQQTPGVYCIEEPENGIHPARIPALLKLLQAIAMDTSYPVEPGNPLRQVIISTHSPSIVSRAPGDSLLVAELRGAIRDGKRFKRAKFSGLANTWRDPEPGRHSLALGTLLSYLNPDGYRPLPEPDPDRDPDAEPGVMDRADVRKMLSPTPPA